ncbi:MAG: DUF2126 domain-containing protein [Verrucomicrobiales bacterium]
MAIHVALHHRSSYTYDRLVGHSPHVVRLRPAPHCRTRVLSYALAIEPGGHFLNWQQDPFSNWHGRVVFPEKTRSLTVTVDLVAEMAVYNPFDFFLEESASQIPFAYESLLAKDLAPFLELGPLTPGFRTYSDSISRAPMPTIDWLVALNQRLWKDIAYGIRLEPGVQTPEETLTLGSGSCRDSAWLLVQVLRHHGLAARFVSGYLLQLKPDVKSLDGPTGAESDFTDLHAWAEVYLPGAGWIGLDPTSGLLAGEGHLPLACTPEPQSAAPITGTTEACESTFSHHMHIARIYESPRVTKPYTEDQWAAIEALGHRVDLDLRAGDVRLTMGGEPTFVSIDDMEGAEWNFHAFGPDKRQLSCALLRRLHQAFGAGGLRHYGQGKWYPGEPLPRWADGAWWRRDGQPLWQDHRLLAEPGQPHGHGSSDAKAFIGHLAGVLGAEAAHVIPAYEDKIYYLWRENKLPANVDAANAHLQDAEENDRLRRLFQTGLEAVTGYALPLQRKRGRWWSGPWFLRRGHLFLGPGDSPMGLRLPLESLPWVEEHEYPFVHETDPLTDFSAPLPSPDDWQIRRAAGTSAAPNLGQASVPVDRPPAPQQSAPWIIRTALCVEPRDGTLHVFLPPVPTTEDYLDLVAAVEETAAALQTPVILEGTPPPFDPRLLNVKVTPDPGVLEVNMPPAECWGEAVSLTTTLYDEARHVRLGSEKFMIDGRHVGTGGGNHIVLGGPTPADSPFLRRPDLLRSLIAYWQNHPGLSYLFSGLFIGPTSQHPRIDEARHDSLDELELAFAQLPDPGVEVPPWLVDRLFRHLLTDAAGNTHRAEFCIDKLFDPDSPTGRLGLLELRAFEMPPHARMSLVQQLLLRALVAVFWNTPYTRPLVRWGTALHDRFCLPWFVAQDISEVAADLLAWGQPFEFDWLAPHLEFRFPLLGSFIQRGVVVELRTALEPWHVLGEQGAAGGTTRYVDSSLERLEVRVRGLTGKRFVVTCNGHALPLHPTGTEGEAVAGVRFRAWQPPECLHPTIGVHAPLTFDLVDTWNERSVGGCQYHVSHPGGRSYDTLPVNAYEAESRRLTRFTLVGHTPGRVVVAPTAINPAHPFTLDLRRAS